MPLLAKFQIYPQGRWYFFTVFIWKQRSAMIAALKKLYVNYHKAEAMCCAHRVYRGTRKYHKLTGCLGQIHFYKKSFTMRIITHECGHAALYWAHVTRLNPMQESVEEMASPDEEEFCTVLGELARQIVLKTERQWDYSGRCIRRDEAD